MFGYVRPMKSELKLREFDAYQAVYCGLCHTMAKRYGFLARFMLNYDFTFLAMVLTPSTDQPRTCKRRCPAHPFKKRSVCLCDDGFEVSADESLILAYCKLKDDVADKSFFRGFPARIITIVLRRAYRRAVANRPEFDATVRECLELLQVLERSNSASIDRTADTFARILSAAAPVSGIETKDRALGQLLYHIGRWIYLIDAWDDLAEDARTGSYNPVSVRFDGRPEEHRDSMRVTLKHSLNLAASAYHLVDFGCWSDILGNILFLGLPTVEEMVFQGTFPKRNRIIPVWSGEEKYFRN
ncbi:MAG: hypothetical protein H6Q60_1224 [Oscillospiraceae bacterium]|nr:hypothetical protein [Oscillospiraceae bacterium]